MKPPTAQFTEFNVAHLGLIPIQHRLSEASRKGWTSEVGDSRNGAGISVQTTSQEGVPYGVAGDVFAGLVTASIAAREGGESSVTLTFAELARLSSLSTRADDYQNLRRSLNQLVSARFEIWNRWRTPLHQIADERVFSLVQDIQVIRKEHLFAPGQEERAYTVTLNTHILQSLDGALTLMTSPMLLAQLKSPAARGLYRILETFRRDPRDFTNTYDKVMLTSRELVETCRVLGGRDEAAKRLSPLFHPSGPFSQLKAAGYLLDVATVGRGWDTQISLRFAHSNNLLNTGALRLLHEAGVTGTNATSLASLHSPEEIECAIWMTEEKMKKGKVTNQPGLIIHLLKDNGLPIYLESYRNRKKPVSTIKAIRKIQESATKDAELERSEQEMSSIAQANLSSLSAMRRITLEQRDKLQNALDDGRINVSQITQFMMMTSQVLNETIFKLLETQSDLQN